MTTAYTPPRSRVFQTIVSETSTTEPQRNVLIVGPNFTPMSYERIKEQLKLFAYDAELGTQAAAWPGKPTGGVVDLATAAVYADDVTLAYWTGNSGLTVPATGSTNRVVASATNFATYLSFERDAALYNRDVQLGDAVYVSGTLSDTTPVALTSYVTDLRHAAVAAVTGASAAAVGNAATDTASQTQSQVAGLVNKVEIATLGTAYSGLTSGHLSETYNVTVTTAGAAGVARLQVVSLSGTDNASNVLTSAFSSTTAIGSRGLTATFDDTGTAGTLPDGTSETEFLLGQTWQITVAQAFTAPTSTSSGTYVGTKDTTYIATVTKGGDLTSGSTDGQPLVSVSTTTGVDAAAPIAVAHNTAFALGNYGVTLRLNGTTVSKGDRFLVTVTAASKGAVREVVFAHSLPAGMAGRTVTMTLAIKDNDRIVPITRPGAPSFTQYELSQSGVTTSALYLTHPSWVIAGEEVALPVVDANVYASYRVLNQQYVNQITQFTTADLVSPTPEDPLMYGISIALAEGGGSHVYGLAVPSNDLAGFTHAINRMFGVSGAYYVVALTQDRAINNLFKAHVAECSTPEQALWRRAILNSALETVSPIYVSNDTDLSDGDTGTAVLATIIDDTTLGGTQYTAVTIANGLLLTRGVRAGDTVRANYGVDGAGNETYESYTIDRVISEEDAYLVSGPAGANTIPSKVEIWRNLTTAEAAINYGNISASFGNDGRVIHVGPDVCNIGTRVVPGYFGSCALAGAAAMVEQHQGLTNYAFSTITSVPRCTAYFSEQDLNEMASRGTCIITQDTDGTVYVRHQLTTAGPTDSKRGEISWLTNYDMLSYKGMEIFRRYAGRTNNTDALYETIRTLLRETYDEETRVTNPLLGPHVTEYEIVEVRAHSTLKTRAVAVVNAATPDVNNGVDLYLVG